MSQKVATATFWLMLPFWFGTYCGTYCANVSHERGKPLLDATACTHRSQSDMHR